MELRAPVAVPVEIRGPGRRVYRLARSIGEDGVRLVQAAPFEPGCPVTLRFRLPDDEVTGPTLGEESVARAEVVATTEDGEAGADAGGRELRFLDPPAGLRSRARAYVAARLGLEPLGLAPGAAAAS